MKQIAIPWILLIIISIQKNIAAAEMRILVGCLNGISKLLCSLNEDQMWKKNIVLNEERRMINTIVKQSAKFSKRQFFRTHIGNKNSFHCFRLAFLSKNFALHKSDIEINKCYDDYLEKLDQMINPEFECGRHLMEAVGRIVIECCGGISSCGGRRSTCLEKCGNIEYRIKNYIHEQEISMFECFNRVYTDLRESMWESEDNMEDCIIKNIPLCKSGCKRRCTAITRQQCYI